MRKFIFLLIICLGGMGVIYSMNIRPETKDVIKPVELTDSSKAETPKPAVPVQSAPVQNIPQQNVPK